VRSEEVVVRRDARLIQRYQTIISYTGLIFFIVGALLLTPLFEVFVEPITTEHLLGFLIPAVVSAVLGFVLWKGFRPVVYATLTIQESGIIVLLTWVGTCLLSTLPFMMISNLGFTQAVFEAVSGWTTTGLTMIDVTREPQCILMYRSIIQLAGGAGLAIIMLASLTGPTGVGHTLAEGRSDQLVPHVRESAKLVLMIYSGYAFIGIVAYRIAGMGFFDAVNHTFTAISTGGFSTRPDSIGAWNSIHIEAVTIVLMIFGSMNFLTAYLLLKGKFRVFFNNGEIRVPATLIPIGVFILFMGVTTELYSTLEKSIRVAVFEVVTSLTGTGFSTVSYGDWNASGLLVLIVLMIIGGGVCSTSGGIKQYRAYVLYKAFTWEIRRAFLPRTAVVKNSIWHGENRKFIDDSHIREIAVFVFLYLVLFIVGTTIIALHGYSLRDSLFEFASSIGTVGLSVGITSPNAPRVVLWTEILGMFLGRLEFFVVFVSVAKIARDAKEIIKV
jgi:trk system potassium uptake protein